jgi:uncharacterized protein with NRDE domain
MCVVALALDCHPRWKLLLAGNRDEYHARASAPLARWSDAPHVLGGRDLVSGGGWLGVSDEGRLAVVTNIRSPGGPDPDKASRGALVSDWLIAGVAPAGDMLDSYNGFCLVTVSAQGAMLIANRPTPACLELAQGIHSLSNGTPAEPWPRREKLELALAEWLKGDADDPADLFALLRPEVDDPAAPLFINAPVYGTRCSSVVAVDQDGQGWICERRFDEAANIAEQSALRFTYE